MKEFGYGFEERMTGISFDDAVKRVTEALQTEGFGILTEIDVQGTLKKKLDIDFRRYLILGACNPHLAHQAIQEEPNIGLLLPCNVVVQENTEGEILVSVADPRAMFTMVEGKTVEPVAKEARERLLRVMASLS